MSKRHGKTPRYINTFPVASATRKAAPVLPVPPVAPVAASDVTAASTAAPQAPHSRSTPWRPQPVAEPTALVPPVPAPSTVGASTFVARPVEPFEPVAALRNSAIPTPAPVPHVAATADIDPVSIPPVQPARQAVDELWADNCARVTLPSTRGTPWRPPSAGTTPNEVEPVPPVTPSSQVAGTVEPVRSPYAVSHSANNQPLNSPAPVPPVTLPRDSAFQPQSVNFARQVPPVPAVASRSTWLPGRPFDEPYRPGSTGKYDAGMSLPFFTGLRRQADDHWSTYRPGSIRRIEHGYSLPFFTPLAERPARVR